MAHHRRIRSILLALAFATTTFFGTGASPTPAATRLSEEELAALWNLASAAGAIGMYRSDDGSIAVVMPASKANALTTSDARAVTPAARVETRDIDAATISAIITRAGTHDWSGGSGGYGVYFDAERGRVVIEGVAEPEAFAPLLAEWPGDVEYRQVEFAGRLSRRNELAPIDGGAAAFDGDTMLPRCTTGFRVVTAAGSRMVTAGHCFSLNEAVWSQDSGISFGTVVARAGFPARDMELLGGAAYADRIYAGNQTGVREEVIGAADPLLTFDNYCYSGWVSAERCSMNVINLNAQYCEGGQCTPNLAAFTGPTVAQGGDSGAPFYIAHSNGTNGMRGMLIARSGNTMYAHKWSTIANQFGATVP